MATVGRRLFVVLHLLNPVVTAFLEFEGEFRATSAHNTTFVEHMDKVGFDVVEQALVVSNHDGSVALGLEFVNASSHNPESIDVETAVGFVEN